MEEQGKLTLLLLLMLEETHAGFPYDDSSGFISIPLSMLRPNLPSTTLVRVFITQDVIKSQMLSLHLFRSSNHFCHPIKMACYVETCFHPCEGTYWITGDSLHEPLSLIHEYFFLKRFLSLCSPGILIYSCILLLLCPPVWVMGLTVLAKGVLKRLPPFLFYRML